MLILMLFRSNQEGIFLDYDRLPEIQLNNYKESHFKFAANQLKLNVL